MKFNVGDRVTIVYDPSCAGLEGKQGTVTGVYWCGFRAETELELSVDNWSGGYSRIDRDRTATDMIILRESDVKLALHEDPVALLPTNPKSRKEIPLSSGLLDYFTSALIEVSKVSYKGNEQHNPGEPLHWARGKSTDHADTMLRHFVERGTIDTDGTRHSAKLVWRALAILQMELENEGYPKARGAR